MSYQSNEISRILPSGLASAEGYGNYETVNALSNLSAGTIDRNLLTHENPTNCTDLAPALPLDQYKLNVDQNPHVIRRKAQEKVQYQQEIAVRYLKPPPPPRAGDIVIRQMANKQHAPAPPLIVRQQGPTAPTPQPLTIREAPPQPPQALAGKQITIPGKTIPPPARKVIIERLPPTPAKPQQVFVERWLPYGQQTQRVVFQACKQGCVIPDPKNVVIQWDAPEVEIRREFKNLGVVEANPQEYISKYGSSLVRADALPEIAVKVSQQPGVQLAANTRVEQQVVLEGDVQALKLIDLEANGLGHLRSRIGASAAQSSSAADYSASSAAAAAAGGFSAASASYEASYGSNAAASASAAYGGSASYGGASYEADSYGDNTYNNYQ